MSDKKISALTAATTPLAGTEVLPIVQGGATVKVSVENLTAGRDISFKDVTYSGALTGGAGIINIGSGQIYKNVAGDTGFGLTSPEARMHVLGNNGFNGTAAFFTTDGNGGVSFSGYGGIAYIQGQTTAKGASIPLVLNQNGGSLGIGGASFGSGVLVAFIANATTVPSANPSGGGILYVEAGALKYRGSSGTVTVLGNA